jgi:hypothetical protein
MSEIIQKISGPCRVIFSPEYSALRSAFTDNERRGLLSKMTKLVESGARETEGEHLSDSETDASNLASDSST